MRDYWTDQERENEAGHALGAAEFTQMEDGGMSVYVDELFTTDRILTGQAGRVFGSGKQSCHMTADTPGELHIFAARAGLERDWAQHEGRWTLHYDLTASGRRVAVALGAVEVTARDDARRIAAAMKAV